jgi:hypothetical protein
MSKFIVLKTQFGLSRPDATMPGIMDCGHEDAISCPVIAKVGMVCRKIRRLKWLMASGIETAAEAIGSRFSRGIDQLHHNRP